MFTYHDSVHPGMRLLSEKPICLEPCADYRGRMGSSTGVPRAFSFFFFFFLENAVFVVTIRFLRTLTTEDCVLGDLSVSFTKRVDAGPGPG